MRPLRIFAVLMLVSGCGYLTGLRRDAGNVIDRRNKAIGGEISAALDLVAPPVQKQVSEEPVPEPAEKTEDTVDTEIEVAPTNVTREPVDISAMDIQEIDVLLQNVYQRLKQAEYHTERQDDWIRPLKKDMGEVKAEKELQLDTRKEWDRAVEYSGKAGARAYRRGWWGRLKARAVTFIKDVVTSIILKWLPWGLGVFLIMTFAGNLWQWIKGRFWKKAAVGYEHKVERLKGAVDSEKFAECMGDEEDEWVNGHVAVVHERQKTRRKIGKAPKVVVSEAKT